MTIAFSVHAWNDYQYWVETDKKVLERINELIKSIAREPFTGLGKPEPLKGDLKGFWSRRINHEHRIVYRFSKNTVEIIACRYHY
jgi:toxin YoeB